MCRGYYEKCLPRWLRLRTRYTYNSEWFGFQCFQKRQHDLRVHIQNIFRWVICKQTYRILCTAAAPTTGGQRGLLLGFNLTHFYVKLVQKIYLERFFFIIFYMFHLPSSHLLDITGVVVEHTRNSQKLTNRSFQNWHL